MAMTQTELVSRWRKAHPEQYREQKQVEQRKRRAKMHYSQEKEYRQVLVLDPMCEPYRIRLEEYNEHKAEYEALNIPVQIDVKEAKKKERL
jgi:hypothetical protein